MLRRGFRLSCFEPRFCSANVASNSPPSAADDDPKDTLGPPRVASSSPLTASTASRMASASKRLGDQCHQYLFSGSTLAFSGFVSAAWRYVLESTINR